jgi:molybdate transport system substrate-binding protein
MGAFARMWIRRLKEFSKSILIGSNDPKPKPKVFLLGVLERKEKMRPFSSIHISLSRHALCTLCSASSFLFAVALLLIPSQHAESSERLLIFAGAASKPATEEVTHFFQKESGISVNILFGGSGFVLAQMKLARKGDLYFPGSSDFMEKAKKENLVFPESEKIVVYLIPAINVQKGNPKGIHSLRDLTKKGTRVAIANPEFVCVGTYAIEIIEKNLSPSEKEDFKRNLVNYTESCEKTANAISLKAVDAVLGWRVFQYWDPERIETVYLKPGEIPRIGYVPIAISRFTQDRRIAQGFIDFLFSSQGKAIFRKYHYLMEAQEARQFTRPDTPVGGEYVLPNEWRTMAGK